MRKISALLLLCLLLLGLSACNQEIEYVSNYQLDDVTFFRVHQDDMYPIFMNSENQLFLLDSDVEKIWDMDHATRIQVLFGTHDPKDEAYEELLYTEITDDIPLQSEESVIDIIDYFEGWLFLTSLGNVYKYELVTEPEMDKDYFVAGGDNLITLSPDETITNFYYQNQFQMEVLRFETSEGRYFDFFEDEYNAIFGYPLYDDSIFDDNETARSVLFEWSDDKYYIVTDNERVLQFDTITKETVEVTNEFPLLEGERILKINHDSDFRRVYITNYGRVVTISLDDFEIHGEHYLDLGLTNGEEIISYQRGYYSCKEGMAFMETNHGNYFYTYGIDQDPHPFDPSIVSLNDGDSIEMITMSYYATNQCGTSSDMMYNGLRMGDFEFVLTINTSMGHTYLVGALWKHDLGKLDSDFLILQIK